MSGFAGTDSWLACCLCHIHGSLGSLVWEVLFEPQETPGALVPLQS